MPTQRWYPEKRLKHLRKSSKRSIVGGKRRLEGRLPQGVGHGGRPMAEPRRYDLGGSASPRAGDLLKVPIQRVSANNLHALSNLDSQTTSESDETSTTTSLTERASQQIKKHVNMTIVLRENTQNQRKEGEMVDRRRKTRARRPPAPRGRPWG